ncbi:hypothetical protein J1605_004745 [Eschrichtius robustus]|uniref:KH-like RNA-binding domain-containing protein n=1 Tax=Eschrichtius robustus TaxID=9764 RepID=A0AB34HCQ3_ESCRO|nr:hypothetical protein J1605_004745 [Eschrichtius robustus]
MEIKPWWLVPENFTFPLEFYIEEDQEELLFGPLDLDLARVEAHNQTLIQLETRLTATSLTCVLVWGWPS